MKYPSHGDIRRLSKFLSTARSIGGAAAFVVVCAAQAQSAAQAADRVRVGVLKFGTVNWELDTVVRNGYDRKHGLAVEIEPFANKQATAIAFFNGAVDMHVTDWLWVSRARTEGKDISFIPYSKALGALMTPPDSKATSLKGLNGMRVGVAGGPYDKSWLLLRAWARGDRGFDPSESFDVKYAAPPLLNGQIRHGHLDAVLNFWHYCARLESAGYRRLIDMGEVLKGLGVRNTPMVGYVFRTPWARDNTRDNRDIAERFNLAVREARARLATDDAEWEHLRALMKAPDEAVFAALRKRYREGIPLRWGKEDEAAAQKLTGLFHTAGGKELTASERLAPGTFWTKAYF